MKKSLFIVILLAVVLFGSPLYALSTASSNALNAFRRYEPDFSNSLNRLKELDRRIINENISPKDARYEDIFNEAQDKMEYVQKRYDLVEDLFKTVSSDYPADRAELFDGFSRIDDLYTEVRDFYSEKFTYRNNSKNQSSQDKKIAKDKKTVASNKAVSVENKKQPANSMPSSNKNTAVENEQHKLLITGLMKLDLRNRNEVYRTQTKTTPFTTAETALPNNYGQAKLALTYKFNKKRELYLEDRYLRRERNEPVKENYFTSSYLFKTAKGQAWTIKNTLHHSWYPDNSIKDYRNNLFEAFYNNQWSKRERLTNLGYQTRFYPNYTQSDFHQFNFSDQETWFINNGNIFAEINTNWRKYRNVNNLDYDNVNLYAEYNKTYSGNKSDLSVSNTFDKRLYKNESVNLYRASYFDNYFRVNYDLPIHEKLSYVFEGEYQKRNYQADDPRGYAEMNLKTAAKFKFSNVSRGQLDYKYTYNDENTRARAHRNHQLHGMWQKRFKSKFKIRVDDTFHKRNSVVGEIMDFRENDLVAKLAWKLRNKMKLAWTNTYHTRVYDQTFYRDYKYLKTGAVLSYAKARKYDWNLEQSWRKFSFRNGNNASTGWEAETQPLTEAKYNLTLRDNLKLRLRASWEKSYYRSFDTISQELLWDFTRPMTITEFYGGLEYQF